MLEGFCLWLLDGGFTRGCVRKHPWNASHLNRYLGCATDPPRERLSTRDIKGFFTTYPGYCRNRGPLAEHLRAVRYSIDRLIALLRHQGRFDEPDDTSTPSEQCPAVYRPRRPAETVLYQVVAQHLESYLYLARQGDLDFDAVPEYVEREFRKYLACGILAHGFARARCAGCGHDVLIPFSCKGRGVCGSCNGRRIAELAPHLTDHVFPAQPVRQGRCCRYPSACATSCTRTQPPPRPYGTSSYGPSRPSCAESVPVRGPRRDSECDDPAQQTVLYHLPKPAPDGCLVLKLQPLELIDKLVALIPPPRLHRHRYHGLLAPNAPWREQITAEANEQAPLTEPAEQAVAEKAPSDTTDGDESEPLTRPRSHYLWAVLLARLFEVFPLTCPRCGQPMRILALTYRDVLMPREAGCRKRPSPKRLPCNASLAPPQPSRPAADRRNGRRRSNRCSLTRESNPSSSIRSTRPSAGNTPYLVSVAPVVDRSGEGEGSSEPRHLTP